MTRPVVTNSAAPTYAELRALFDSARAYHGDDLRPFWECIADHWERLPDPSVARWMSSALERLYSPRHIPSNGRILAIVDALDELH